MKILIAPNSFKESVSSVQISKIFAEEFSHEENFQQIILPLSDGGDGFLDVIKFIYGDEITEYEFPVEFTNEKFNAPVLFNKITKRLFVESAEVIGLKRVPEKNRHPLGLNTYALGKLIRDLIELNNSDVMPAFEKIIIGIGGTSTIDFGLGAVHALGVKFLDSNGREIDPIPKNFHLITDILLPSSPNQSISQSANQQIIQSINPSHLNCIVDVQTPLLGAKSAIDLYGPQKGATIEELNLIKKGIENIASLLIKKNIITDLENLNGAGGGLSSGLKIFFNAEIISAKDFLFNEILTGRDLSQIDFLITGEGRFDIQSFEGKATGELIKRYSGKVKKIFLVCGKIESDVNNLLPSNVQCFQLIDLFKDESESLLKTEAGLKIIASKLKYYFKDNF